MKSDSSSSAGLFAGRRPVCSLRVYTLSETEQVAPHPVRPAGRRRRRRPGPAPEGAVHPGRSTASTSAGSSTTATRTRSRPRTRSTSGSTPTRAGASPTRCASSRRCGDERGGAEPARRHRGRRDPQRGRLLRPDRDRALDEPAVPGHRGARGHRRRRGHGEDRAPAARRSRRSSSRRRRRSRPQFGIELVDVRFKRINYVDSVQQKVFERMISERKRIAERSRSEGQGRAAEIRGQKERDVLGASSGGLQDRPGGEGQSPTPRRRRSTRRPTAATRSSTSS